MGWVSRREARRFVGIGLVNHVYAATGITSVSSPLHVSRSASRYCSPSRSILGLDITRTFQRNRLPYPSFPLTRMSMKHKRDGYLSHFHHSCALYLIWTRHSTFISASPENAGNVNPLTSGIDEVLCQVSCQFYHIPSNKHIHG